MLVKHLIGIIALPVTVLLVVPVLLVSLLPFVLFWGFQNEVAIALFTVGVVTIVSGFILLGSTISLFIKKGEGTIAPWNPTRKLIVTGFYSHVRNPMHMGVFLILAGESVTVGSVPLFLWASFFIMGNLLYVPLVEEKKLLERFGEEYMAYKNNVPMWIPRFSAWKASSETIND